MGGKREPSPHQGLHQQQQLRWDACSRFWEGLRQQQNLGPDRDWTRGSGLAVPDAPTGPSNPETLDPDHASSESDTAVRLL